jgi:hypothetical protein
MANHRNRFPARRRFLKQSTALTATVVALPLPGLARAGKDPDTQNPSTQPADAQRTPRPARPPQRPRRIDEGK